MLTITTLNLYWPRKKAKSYACEWLVLWLFADINDCLPNPCQYGANCTDRVNNYTCTCAAGYSGRNCSISKSHVLNLGCSLTTTRHQYQLSLAKYSIQLTVSQCFQFMVTLDKDCNHVLHVCNKSASLTLDRAPCSIFFFQISTIVPVVHARITEAVMIRLMTTIAPVPQGTLAKTALKVNQSRSLWSLISQMEHWGV